MSGGGYGYQQNSMIPPTTARGNAPDGSMFSAQMRSSNPNTPPLRGSPIPSHSSYGSSPAHGRSPSYNTGTGTRPVSPSMKDPNEVFGGLVNFGANSKPSLSSMTLDQQRKMAQNQPLSQKSAAWVPSGQTPPRSISPNSFGLRAQPAMPATSNIPVSGGYQSFAKPTAASLGLFDDLLGNNSQPKNPAPTLQSQISSQPPRFQQQAASQPTADIWDLDYLAKEKPSPLSTSVSLPPTSSQQDPFDFSIFESKPPPKSELPSPPQPARPHQKQTQSPSQSYRQPDISPVLSQSRESPLDKPRKPASPEFNSTYRDSSDDESSDDDGGRSKQRNRGDNIDGLITQVEEMGFDRKSAAIALEASNNNVGMALDLLMANRDAMQNTSIRRPSASRFDAGSARDHNAPLQSQVVSTASSISKSVFTNAKSVFEFSKKKITEVYSKASEKISEQVDSFNAAPESRSAGGPYPDKGGAQGGSFWSDRWQEDNGDERQTYKKYETDSSSDEETLRKPVRKTTPYSDSAPSQSKWEANYSDNEEALRKPVRKTAPSADQTGSQARWESKVAETQPKSWDSGMPEFREMQWDSPAAKVPSPTFSKIPEKPKPQPVSLASQNQLKASEEFREKGNDKFKSGQFGEAEELYSQALNCLPAGDWGRIAVLNNRAAARLKTGDHNGVVSDCTEVQSLNAEDLKSLLRRATAYEAKEKWDLAKTDYETILAKDTSVKGVSQGLARVKKALSPEVSEGPQGASPFQSPAPKPRPFKKPTNPLADFQSFDAPNGKKVEELREKNEKMEKEEALKISLTDNVEARINAWKNGKDNNIRALLSSLDTILWKESNWVSINLSELITPQQVKIKYMKAVAKVHPDKLKPDTSVEQRMIANNVFGVLNKAWDSFKQANGL